MVPVLDDDTAESLHERIKTEERRMLVGAVGRIAREGFVVEGRLVRFGGAVG
jgi:phosphoribosylglycinamide formyltransferase-1